MKLRNQRGFTLMEMLVALLIAGIFFSIFVGVILATFETLRSGDERTVAQQNARVGLNFIANDIRHATEIVPLRLEAYRDYVNDGMPYDSDTLDPFDPLWGTDAWPIIRRSTDSDPDGYILLDVDGGGSEANEYDLFRDDGYPYDVRPICPNRISLLYYGSQYYPNTEYWAGFGEPIDLDGNSTPNPTAALTRVTYEHQLVRPLDDPIEDGINDSPVSNDTEIYEDNFSGRSKQFDMVVNRTDADAVQDNADFVITRTFEIDNPLDGLVDYGETSMRGLGELGNLSYQMQMDEPYLRQPVADHVVSMRFRYWHITGNSMLEIRYDNNVDHIGGNSTGTNDGYFRYYDIYGSEIYAWYHGEAAQNVDLIEVTIDPLTGRPLYDPDDVDDLPANTFIISGGPDGDDEFQRGVILFEGWRYINAVSISVKTANNQTLTLYRSSINHEIQFDDHPDYGMGFIDFGHDIAFTDDDHTSTDLNTYEPFYQGVDNLRMDYTPVEGAYFFDFVEPNMNSNFNANSFTTLQTFVAPHQLKDKSNRAELLLTLGFNWK